MKLLAQIAADPTAMALIAGNLIVATIAAFHPPVSAALLVVYWLECLIIGAFNMIKLQYVLMPGEDRAIVLDTWRRRRDLWIGAGVFAIHYGIFLFMAYAMLVWLVGEELQARGVRQPQGFAIAVGYLWPAVFLVASHGWSFLRNFLGKREYEGRGFERQMFAPYPRVAFMMGIALAAGALVHFSGVPDAVMLVVVPFKLWADLRAHFRDHAKR